MKKQIQAALKLLHYLKLGLTISQNLAYSMCKSQFNEPNKSTKSTIMLSYSFSIKNSMHF